MDVLRSLYHEVTTLEDWLINLCSVGLQSSLLKDEDHSKYKELLKTTLVGVPADVKESRRTFTLSQHSHQREVILRSIKRILTKEGPGTNVLTTGYGLMSDDQNAQLSRDLKVECRYPNNNVNRLHFEVWRFLLSRIGDDMMSFILEKTSVFIQIVPTCYLQLTGKPVHSLWSFGSEKIFKRHRRPLTERQSRWKTRAVSATRNQKKKSVKKAENKKKNHASQGQIDKVTHVEKRIEHLKAACGQELDKLRSEAKQYANDYTRRLIQSQIEVTLENLTSVSRKRYPAPQKRKRIETVDEETIVNKRSRSENYETGQDLSAQQRRENADTEMSSTSARQVPEETLDSECIDYLDDSDFESSQNQIYSQNLNAFSVVEGIVNVNKDNPTLIEATSTELSPLPMEDFKKRNDDKEIQKHSMYSSRTGQCFSEDVNNSKTDILESSSPNRQTNEGRKIKKCRKRKRSRKRCGKDQKKCQDFKPFDHLKCIQRSRTLYNRNVRERFPKAEFLSTLIDSDAGALQLYQSIFVDSSVHLLPTNIRVLTPSLMPLSDCEGEAGNKPDIQDADSLKFMDVQTDVKMNIQTDVQTDLRTDVQTNIQTDAQTDVQMDVQTDVQMNILTDVQTDVQMDVQIESVQGFKQHSGVRHTDLCTSTTDQNNFQPLSCQDTTEHCVGVSENVDHTVIPNSDICVGREPDEKRLSRAQEMTSACATELRATNKISEQVIEKVYHVKEHNKMADNAIEVEQTHIFGNVTLATEQKELNLDEAREARESSQGYKAGQVSSQSDVSDPSEVCIPAIPRVLPELQKFISQFRSVPHRTLLNHHCPVRSVYREKGPGKVKGHVGRRRKGLLLFSQRTFPGKSTERLLGDHIHHRQVFLFLRSVVLRTVPFSWFGSTHNRNVILKNISLFVSLGKLDKLYLGHLMDSLKSTDLVWLESLHNNTARLHLLAKLVFWFFNHYLVLIIKTFFYITDATTLSRNRLLYYRQKVWNILYTRAFTDLVFDKRILRPIGESECQKLLETKKSLGVSTLRFLPKQRALRPITNMGVTGTTFPGQKLSINKQLGNLHQIISFIKERHPDSVGNGKLGMNEIYTTWRDFVLKWKSDVKPKLYFVKTDIANCYDTILQSNLYSIVENLLKQYDEEIVVVKYAKVYKHGRCLKRVFDTSVRPFSQYQPDFVLQARDIIKQQALHDVILVDKVIRQHEICESLLQVLQAHLFNNLIKVGSRHFLQTQGISQGSILSTLLCSFYYAEMEAEHIHVAENDLLMRVVDDFLFVTDNRQRADDFLKTMLNGITDYNCQTNALKVLTSFSPEASDWFPWCGLMFNIHTLSVTPDYSRYAGTSMGDSMTYEYSSKPGQALCNKLKQSIRPKCHQIYMDPEVNTWEQIVQNVYQLFILAAFKFHSFAKRLLQKQRVDGNPGYFLGVILGVVSFVWSQCQTTKYTNHQRQEESSRFPLCKDAVKWICLKAFHVKVGQHMSQYKMLRKCIKSSLKVTGSTLMSEEKEQMMVIFGVKLPDEFKNVLT